MDITKSRKEFEAWWNAPEQAELRNSCAMGWGFRIWKAARESIEVELSELCGDGENDTDYTEGLNDGINQSARALRTTGIRIKGESE